MNNAIAKGVFYQYEIKKSRFITYLEPVANKAAAKARIEAIRQQYPDARHHCWAFICPPDVGMNDDGEPSGTAGKPMLNVLQHQDLTQVLAVVVRYFGGIKLGAGGLTRAYSRAVSEAVKQADIIVPVKTQTLTLSLPFEMENKIRHLIQTFDGQLLRTDYQQQLVMVVELVEEKASDFKHQISEQGQGRVTLQETE